MNIHKGKSRVRIQSFSICSLVIACIMAALFLLLSLLGMRDFNLLENSTKQYILCSNAARQLQEGSDTLTSQVRMYAMTQDASFLDGYFQEALESAAVKMPSLPSAACFQTRIWWKHWSRHSGNPGI